MRRRLLSTLLSSLCLIAATSLLIAFIKLYTVPHTLTSSFFPSTCKMVDADNCLEECKMADGRSTDHRETEETMVIGRTQDTAEQVGKVDRTGPKPAEQVSNKENGKISGNHNSRINENIKGTQDMRGKSNIAKGSINVTLSSSITSSMKDLKTPPNVSYVNGGIQERFGSDINHLHEASDTHHNQNTQHLNIVYGYPNTTSDRTPYSQRSKDNQDLSLPETDETAGGAVCCQTGLSRCDRVYVDVMDTESVERVPLIEDPWIYYSLVTVDKPVTCTCPSCNISSQSHNTPLTVSIGDSTFTIEGDTFTCYVNILAPEPEILLYKMSTLVVLNLMLWPTLVFMVGFVGLFFSCLYLQYEECSDNWCARSLRI